MMMPAIRNISLTAVDIKVDPDFDPGVGGQINTQFALAIVRGPLVKNLRLRQANFVCVLHPNDGQHCAYVGMIQGTMELGFDNSFSGSDTDIDDIAAKQSVNPLIGAVRGWIAMITGCGPYPRVSLNWVSPLSVLQNAMLVEVSSGEPTRLYSDNDPRLPSSAPPKLPPSAGAHKKSKKPKVAKKGTKKVPKKVLK